MSRFMTDMSLNRWWISVEKFEEAWCTSWRDLPLLPPGQKNLEASAAERIQLSLKSHELGLTVHYLHHSYWAHAFCLFVGLHLFYNLGM